MTLLGPAEVRAVAAELGISPRKSMGQNFVIDPNTIRRIVRLAQLPQRAHVLEIGPGLGSLTLGLLEAGHAVTAVELDPALARQLPRTVGDHAPSALARLRVVVGDGASVDGSVLAAAPPAGPGPDEPFQEGPDALVANLPYNVAVPVLLHCLAAFPTLRRALVMVQAEVADRLAAGPGSRVYGVPSVKVRWYGRVRKVGTVPPAVFWPVPRVESGLVQVLAAPPPSSDRDDVFALVDLLFGRRRKMIRGTLATRFGSESAEAALASAGIPPEARAEQLDLAAFVRLAESIQATVGP